MIAVPRSLAKRFRTVLRRCAAPADFSQEPFIVARASSKGLSLQCGLAETAVRFDQIGKQEDEIIAFPASLLAKIEAPSDDLAALEVLNPEQGRAAWHESGTEMNCEFKSSKPAAHQFFPAMPARLTDPGEFFKLALEEAAATASNKITGRPLHRVLLRGKTGEVIATDGRQLLVQGGFKFPWDGDLLVPSIGVWGLRELPDRPVSIACSKEYVFVHAGMLSVALRAETSKSYPNFEAVIPPARSITTHLRFSPADLELLKKQLPRMPGANEKPAPVMLNIGKTAAVRAKADGKETESTQELPGAEIKGKPVCLELDRRVLLRAVKMGFFHIEIVSPHSPLCCRANNRTFVWLPLGEPVKPAPAQPSQPPDSVPSTEEKSAMPEPNGKQTGDGGSAPNGNGFSDPLAEAEAMKGLLTEAQSRLARLIASLKQHRRQSRAVRAAVDSLRQLPPLVP